MNKDFAYLNFSIAAILEAYEVWNELRGDLVLERIEISIARSVWKSARITIAFLINKVTRRDKTSTFFWLDIFPFGVTEVRAKPETEVERRSIQNEKCVNDQLKKD